FVSRWIGLPASSGQHFLLNTGTLCVLATTAKYRQYKFGTDLSSTSLQRGAVVRSGAWVTGERFMPQPKSKRINRAQYDAVLFDLDGVITNTATLHATCWKQMFDEYLRKHAE